MKITEVNFISQLKCKNEDALIYVIEQHGWVIKTIAKKHLHLRPELLEECLNDSLLAVWQNIEAFDSGKNSFQNWLAGITRFKAIDCKRKYIKQFYEEPLEAAENIVDIGSMIQLEQEIAEEMKELLSCLSEQDRGIFERLFWGEESVKTISEEIGIKEAVIYNRVSRGKKKLKQYLTTIGRGNEI